MKNGIYSTVSNDKSPLFFISYLSVIILVIEPSYQEIKYRYEKTCFSIEKNSLDFTFVA